ncbi:MAG: mechanosensitive ion channel family protein, partial [Stellaceae bacterium]
MRLALRIFLVAIFGAAYWFEARGPGLFPHTEFATIALDAAGTLFWLSVASLATELLRVFILQQARRQGFASRMPRLLFDIGGIVIFFCAGLVIISQVFGLELSGLLFTSGIIAAAAGFALQPTATDLIAGISLNFREGTVKIGDWVQVANGVVGKVTQITWSDTHLVTLDDRMVVVRNSKLVELQLMNYSAPQRPYQNKLKITVGFEAPPDRVSAILVTAMKAVPNLVPDPQPYVIIEEFNDNGVPYSMYFHVPDYPEAQFITNQVAINALKFLDQAGFAPAYPKRENYAHATRANR